MCREYTRKVEVTVVSCFCRRRLLQERVAEPVARFLKEMKCGVHQADSSAKAGSWVLLG